MSRRPAGACLGAAMLLAACGGGDREPAGEDARGIIEDAVETQRRPLDEARAVEAQLEDAHQRRLQEIDAQSGDGDG